jgi:hypothetical protein
MKKQLLIIGIIVLLVAVGLSGCSGRDARFIGTWKTDAGGITNTFTLYSDGKCGNTPPIYAISIANRWDIKNNKLVFYSAMTTDELVVLSYSFSFSNNGNTLTLVGGGIGPASTYVCTKQ